MYKILFLLLFSTSVFSQIIPQAEPLDPEEISNPKDKTIENTVDDAKVKKEKPAWMEKLHYGGNLWLGFFGAFYIDASPMAGFEVTEKGTIIGLGTSFIYQGAYKAKGAYAAGVRAFVRQPIWGPIFVHGEYEFMNANEQQFYSAPLFVPGNENKRTWGGSPLIGAGFYQGRNKEQRGSFISLMYNLGAPSFGYISPQGLGGNQSPFLIRFGYFF